MALFSGREAMAKKQTSGGMADPVQLVLSELDYYLASATSAILSNPEFFINVLTMRLSLSMCLSPTDFRFTTNPVCKCFTVLGPLESTPFEVSKDFAIDCNIWPIDVSWPYIHRHEQFH